MDQKLLKTAAVCYSPFVACTAGSIAEKHLEDVKFVMISNEEIPAVVRDFILTKVDSVPHLEALLLVWEQESKTWTEDDLARALFVSPKSAKKIAIDLVRRGWVRRVSANQDGFVFDQSWDPAGDFMKQLSDTYRTRLVRVATLIHSNASAAVRDFSSAFDFKKE